MADEPQLYEWQAVIVGGAGDGSGAFVAFPWNPKDEFGKANLVPIRCEFDGIAYQGSIANMGSGPCIGMLKSIRTQLGKGPGDSVQVRLWHDTAPRVVEAPEDLKSALALNPAAQARWDAFSNSHRKEYVTWLESAKKAETRTSRVAKAVEMIGQGQKLK